MELKYIESDIGKKKLNNFKRVNLVYLISFILITIIYLISCFYVKTINGMFVFSMIYIIVSLFLRLIKVKYVSRVIKETLAQEICLDGFINLNIYRAKKAEKKLKIPKLNKVYNYSLLNIIDGYLRKGNYEQVNDIIRVLEKRQLDNTAKAILIRYKTTVAHNQEEFNILYREFEEISSSITKKLKNQILLSLDLQKIF